MENQPDSLAIAPPRLIPSLVAGFNTVAQNIQLILFPVALDLLLWVGPHIRIKTLFTPLIQEYNHLLTEMNVPDMGEFITAAQQAWDQILERFNLFSLLRTYPVGVTSLMSSSSPIQTPWGTAPMMEVNSVAGLLGLTLVLILIGIVGGSLYFSQIALHLNPKNSQRSFRQMLWEISQMALFNVGAYAVMVLLSIPITLMLLVVAMINATLAQIAIFFIGLLLIWLLVPLIFSPHGVFARHQNVINSTLTSVRLVRLFLPGTGLFILLIILISQGMDVIWHVPAESSWMTLVGILGHGFITTGLICASFSYYLGGIRWMESATSHRTTPAGMSFPGQPRG
jgi:hypothetical protein